MKICFLSIFPDLVSSIFNGLSITRRATKRELVWFDVINIRDFAFDKHKQVDDYAYGIGKGMILRFDVLLKALDHAKKRFVNPYVILPSPRGEVLNKRMINDLAKMNELIFICPNYEGVDNRILRFINEEISIGDYVISSGELASFVILESILRFRFSDDHLVRKENLLDDSFNYMGMDFLLEPLQYTRPREVRINNNVVKVEKLLCSGDHAKIRDFLLMEALEITIFRKPYLFKLFMNRYSGQVDKKILYNACMNSVVPT
ncbi:MAG: tRNA (guanosine(37)-N1)-methyltransferase TrmD [Candidatus Calescibacterium sp.]|nr:tRNA (guanosine(37)-N1)-methyltransferase TrmD [Candidatus Calescibacterium sp.]MDW8132142.1 tRNA (guanosine(37)-N1)-methyltransferase TrmD [Candidatus Calescibacterium sp.]